MGQVLKYFENFAFRGFNFWDRARPAEYWVVMPVIWLVIVFAFIGDVGEFWNFLLRRDIPPLNPLYYESIVLFVLTAIPRLSLTVRRLHDSGKSGRWATLPITAIMSFMVLMVGIGSAMLTSSFSGASAEQVQVFSFLAVLGLFYATSLESAWDGIFTAAIAINAIGWDAIFALMAEVLDSAKGTELTVDAAHIGAGLRDTPAQSGTMLLGMISLIATPFVAAFMHLFFMLLPTDRSHNKYGESEAAPITGKPKSTKPQRDLMQSYACLFEKSPEEEARLREVQKAELKELYRSRVLGQAAAK